MARMGYFDQLTPTVANCKIPEVRFRAHCCHKMLSKFTASRGFKCVAKGTL
jgi:hypothetical protein